MSPAPTDNQTLSDYRRREQSITLSPLEDPSEGGTTNELLTLNFGPHHPATHGVLRLLVTLQGEVVRDVKPIIGYVHTGIEKTAEDKAYWKVIPLVERMDYLAYYFNAMAFVGAVHAVLIVEINHIDTHPLQTRVAAVLHICRIATDAEKLAVGAANVAEFRRQHNVVAPGRDRLANQSLVAADTIHVGSVEEVSPGVKVAMNHADRLGVVHLPRVVEFAHPHAARPIADTSGPPQPSVRRFECF